MERSMQALGKMGEHPREAQRVEDNKLNMEIVTFVALTCSRRYVPRLGTNPQNRSNSNFRLLTHLHRKTFGCVAAVGRVPDASMFEDNEC